MKTNFTIFRNMLAAVLICLVSGSVWGQNTYELVTNKDQLKAGSFYLIVGAILLVITLLVYLFNPSMFK